MCDSAITYRAPSTVLRLVAFHTPQLEEAKVPVVADSPRGMQFLNVLLSGKSGTLLEVPIYTNDSFPNVVV